MIIFAKPALSGNCEFILRGVVAGTLLGSVLLFIAVSTAANGEQQAIEQEVRDGVAKGQAEEEAREQAIMKRHRMPLSSDMGFYLKLGVAAVVGGGIGGVSAAAWSRRKRNRGVA